MANNKSFVVLIFVLCLNLISTNIYAGNAGGWTMGGGVAQGASTVYEGTKKVVIDGVDYIKKGTAKITPSPSGVAKVLARGAAGYALSVAVEQLLGSVDWVLDPANNRIKYFGQSTDINDPSLAYIYKASNNYSGVVPISATIDGLRDTIEKWHETNNNREYTFSKYTQPYPGYPNIFEIQWTYKIGSSTYTQKSEVQKVANPKYDPNAQREPKYLPLETVAAQVISNADSNTDKRVSAQVATTAAAADIVAEAEKDNTKARPIVQQFEASAQTKPADQSAAEKANEATGEAKPNTANPEATDLSLEFPVFCGWAPLVCEAAQVVISFPTTITEIWTAVKEWATEEKDSEDTEVDVEELDLEAESVDINLASGCPAPVVFIDSDFYGQPFKIEFSFDGFCSILSDWVRPILISLGAFIAALILGGVKVNE